MEQRGERYRFFVIEDSRGDFALVEEYLSEQFTVPSITRASTFKEVETVLSGNGEHSFDCILLDLSLPDKSGEALIKEVVYMADNTPVVVITGYSDLSFSVKSLAWGISDYLLKDELSPSFLHKSIVYSIKRSGFSEKIKTSEKKYRDLFEFSPEPMLLVDSDSKKFLDVNQTAIEHYGYNRDEFLSMILEDICLRNGRDESTAVTESEYQLHRKKNGELIKVEIEAKQIAYRDYDAQLILVNDVTEKLEAEKQRDLLESAITKTTESVILIDTSSRTHESKIIYVNDGFCDITGYKAEEVKGRTLDFLFGEKTNTEKATQLRESIFNREASDVELIVYLKDGNTIWMQISMMPVADKNGDHTHMVAIGRNITEQKKVDENLRNSLTEKEILLSEIHHRVKNNLALVSGMLQMQVFDEENEEVLNKLNNSMLRVETMASIHQLLYESSSFSRLEFSKIVNKLMKATHSSFSVDKEIEIEIETEPFELNINQAVPCSLIINEVITNVYKHAFKGRDKGWIKATLLREDKRVRFTMEDDGSGLPENFDMNNLSSLGTKIITALVKQLNGTFRLIPRDEGGTIFQMEFNAIDQEQSSAEEE